MSLVPEAAEPQQPQRPKVSALIVSWNSVDSLRQCLKALDASTYRKDTETLVVDANSRDGSAAIDSEFPWVTMLRVPRHFGKARLRNIAIRTATGDYVLLLAPEVEVEPGTVAKLVARLEADTDVTAVSAKLRTPQGQAVPAAYRLPDAAELKEACRTGRGLPTAAENSPEADAVLDHCLLVRRQFIAGMNYFEEKRFSQYWSDMEMCYQIQRAVKKVATEGDAGAVLHPEKFTVPLNDGELALLEADRINGAANYIGKHAGFGAGLSFKLGFVFSNLFRFRVLGSLLSGERLDSAR